MDRKFKALISWVPFEKGGRREVHAGPMYFTLVRFDEDKTWPVDAWSLAVDFIRSYAQGRYLYGYLRFLAPEALQELLSAGSGFQLYEGRKLVATGLIKEGHAVPVESNEFEQALLH